MRAALVHAYDRPLSLEGVPRQSPAAVQAVLVSLHIIPGREGVGIIEAFGTGNAHGNRGTFPPRRRERVR